MAEVKQFKCGKAVFLKQRFIQDGHAADSETEFRSQGKYGWVRVLPTGRLYIAFDSVGAKRLEEAGVGYMRPRNGKGEVTLQRGEEHFTYLIQEHAAIAFKAVGAFKSRPKQAAVANAWARK